MKIQQRDIKKHLFICINERECGDDCHSKDALKLVKQLKMRLRDEGLWDDHKVSKAGCLGGCAFGIAATLYPDNILLTDITVEDADKLFDLLTD